SAAWWYSVGSARDRRGARRLLALAAGALLAMQVLFFHYWHSTIDAQVAAAAVHNWPDVRPVLAQMLPRILATCAATIAGEYALLRAAGESRARWRTALVVAMGSTALAFPLRNATPDLRMLDAVRALDAPAEAS